MKFVKITRVSESRLKLESNRGVIGKSYALDRLVSKFQRRGFVIERKGYGGLVYAVAPPKYLEIWDKMGFKVGDSVESD